MKALTISQPYASLIARGQKWVENRTWGTEYRGPLAIHAGRGTQYLSTRELHRYPAGAVIAVASLRSCILLDYAREEAAKGKLPYTMRRDGLVAADLAALLAHEHTEGPYCWILGDVRRIDPIPYAGQRGLWEFPDSLLPGSAAIEG